MGDLVYGRSVEEALEDCKQVEEEEPCSMCKKPTKNREVLKVFFGMDEVLLPKCRKCVGKHQKAINKEMKRGMRKLEGKPHNIKIT